MTFSLLLAFLWLVCGVTLLARFVINQEAMLLLFRPRSVLGRLLLTFVLSIEVGGSIAYLFGLREVSGVPTALLASTGFLAYVFGRLCYLDAAAFRRHWRQRRTIAP